LIFQTGPSPITAGDPFSAATQRRADVTSVLYSVNAGMFPQPPPRLGTRGARPPDIPEENSGQPPTLRGNASGQGGRVGNGLWEIRIRHRAGSLDAAVSGTSRRQLAFSFGILLLLCGSIVAIVISTRGARMLAQQQIEFVAAVTHELRTPIAAIRIAGQNLADGLVKDGEKTIRYGNLITQESRRLSGMIEQVLEFAGRQSYRRRMDLQNVAVIELVDNALSDTKSVAQERGFQIETEVQPGLPQIKADELSLRRALKNLLDNSMKYSGRSRWIGLKAFSRRSRKGEEIHISIQDRGIGIPPKEIPCVFEPFFRGNTNTAAQIPGSGLGLSLTKGIVEAHGGKMAVESVLGQGSKFSIILPVSVSDDRK
jgi:signal transduction histidine kinase